MKEFIIADNTDSCRSLWKAARQDGAMLTVFPGLGNIPRGILVEMESEEFQKVAGISSDKRVVLLSNGWTVIVPLKDIHPI